MSDFEKAVRHALIDRGMTLTDLANSLDLSVGYVSDILNGNRKAEAQKARIKDFLQIKDGDDDDRKTDC